MTTASKRLKDTMRKRTATAGQQKADTSKTSAKQCKPMTAKQAKNSNRGSKPGEHRGGRGKGTPNKATLAAREAIAKFVNDNAHRLQEWLDKIAADDPERAFTLFQSVIEYHVPKLARSELTGAGGAPLAPPTIHVNFPSTRPLR